MRLLKEMGFSSTRRVLFIASIATCILTLILTVHTGVLQQKHILTHASSGEITAKKVLLSASIKNGSSFDSGGYLVDTSACKIPNMDALDASVRYLVNAPLYVNCDHQKSFSYVQNDTIFVDHASLNEFIEPDSVSYCRVWPIARPVSKATHKNSWTYLDSHTSFTNSTKIRNDFIHLKCFNSSDKIIYQNFHSSVIVKNQIEQNCSTKYRASQKRYPTITDRLSVKVIGLDSISRLNSVRFLKRTRQFIIDKLNGTELYGYTKVGDNTFPNIVPMLTGKYVSELPWDEKRPVVFDRFPFIWKNYSDRGYRTLFLEDEPYGAIFDYLKPGFHVTPTDYYNRHYHLAMSQYKKMWYNDRNCIVDQSQTSLVLDYAFDFMLKFKSKPYFGFSFITRLTHDILELTAAADDLYYDFLNKTLENGLLNNTILFFMSDHGIRFGPIRKTFIGKMEERLPMMFVVLPEWFKRKYPFVNKNLRQNSHMLTTPFDIYKTFLDILNFKGNKPPIFSSNKRSKSLFRTIPENRSCKDASIDPHWCACANLDEISPSQKSVKKAAEYLLLKINEKLSNVSHLCEKLEIADIPSSYKIRPTNDELQKMSTSYQITITLHPGGGMFEGTVHVYHRSETNSLGSDISRINSYGQERRCSVGYREEKFCYCKSNKIKS